MTWFRGRSDGCAGERFRLDTREFLVLQNRVRRLRRLDCCAVSDALDRLKLPGVVSGVPQQSGNRRIAGAVITLKLGTGELPPGPVRHLGTLAVESGGSEHVIVVEQSTGVEAGSWGGLLTLGARLRGIAGVVADGPVRDIDEAQGCDFPIFARSLTARTARGRVIEEGTNVPVSVWGVAVSPGDFVIADRSAVIFIPADRLDSVLDAAEAIVARESAMAKALVAGVSISQVMGGDYEHMLEG
jgi:4-hydroxy-4-methyl-2-oxoglutarate aldolase